MSGFSFPPPPPPPPKPVQPEQHPYQNRSRGRGRGGVRGGTNQRGGPGFGARGSHPSSGFQTARSGQQGSVAAGAYQNASIVSRQQASNPNQTQPGLSNSALPPGSYVNPRFTGYHHANNFTPPNPIALPYSGELNQGGNGTDFPSRTAAGHKRKLDALRGPSREKKPAPPTAPSIPGFGTATLPAKPSLSNDGSQSKVRSDVEPGSSTRSLGLVPRNEEHQYSSSDNEDADQEIDEEAAYAELGDKLTFEHNGVLLSLNSVADLESWKKERRKNYPTARRKAEKYVERQRIGKERKRLLEGARILQHASQRNSFKTDRPKDMRSGETCQNAATNASIKLEVPETALEKATREVDERTKQLDELRRKVAQSEDKNRKARAERFARDDNASQPMVKGEATDGLEIGLPITKDESSHVKYETDEQASGMIGEVHDTVNIKIESNVSDEPDTTIQAEDPENLELDAEWHNEEGDAVDTIDGITSASSSSVSSESSDEMDFDDEPPEEVDSKPITMATTATSMPVCRYFAASGRCRDGDACRFKHEAQPEHGLQNQQVQQRRQQKRGGIQDFVSKRSATHRKGIFERLQEQEQEEEDRLALKVIKYLGSVGFFKEAVPKKEEP